MSDATLNQRRALYNMALALGEDMRGFRDLSFSEASKKIDELKAKINKNGFPTKTEPAEKYQPDFDGRV